MSVVIALVCVAALLGTAVLALIVGRAPLGRWLVYGLSLAATALALAAGLSHLIANGGDATVVLPLGLPWLGAQFRVDPLAAFFLSVINLGGAAASLYALGYGRHEESPLRVLPFFPAFLAGMNLVLLADDAFAFLLSWEFMSLSSWALVIAHHRERANVRAGYVYLIMASFGTLALLLAFGLLAGGDVGHGFAAMRDAAYTPAKAGAILALVLLGTGSKAGLVPLHVWLPLAHPAAPSHVSALMSGVMTKVAVYGFVRIVFDLVGEPAWWWGLLVLILGGITAALGVLYALMQRDLKRLLAYSTIENLGVIFIGLGLSLAFHANGMTAAAALALAAALFHALNHSLFKSLLFFGAGAVLTATGERDMEKLGGLIHRMPATAFLFLTGCIAISALPPLNGFVSEWLTFQAVLLSPDLPQWGLKLLVPGVGALLALAAALAAACFIRAFGIVFLSRPRAPEAANAREVDRISIAAMAAFALLCVLAGIVPGVVIDWMSPVTTGLLGQHLPVQRAVPWLSLVPISAERSSYNGLLSLLFIGASAGIVTYIIHRFGSRAVRRGPAWDCGYPEPSTVTQYTAGSFSQPIRRVFGSLVFRAREEIEMPPPGDMRAARLTIHLRDLVWDILYAPVARAVGFVAERLNHLQFLTIRRYMGMVFLALVILLLVLALWH